MRGTPVLEHFARGVSPAHIEVLPLTFRLEPDGKSHRLLHHVAVEPGDLLGPGLDPERSIREAGDCMQGVAFQRQP